MEMAQLFVFVTIFAGGWWLCHNIWLFQNRHENYPCSPWKITNNIPSLHWWPTEVPRRKFTLKLAKYTTCRLVQCFSAITLDSPNIEVDFDWQGEIKYHIGLTMSPEDGLLVRMKTT
ncbi:hypothetical protein BKA67DRAFT_535226 [Truncatella angustata]|uniref:Uncharacterized protein n=1 Tax=Truncatella angustata TaxID=152316 RepID=A0A9P8UKI0_9PEZI|nr:uncharacterized protein BKA67DRAFT_535226 [Truncatella angustata]KAH6653879.1 hypothetical protein BKA67DRAFT_535226 [Truncatella angustata]